MELIFDRVTKQYKNKLAVDRVSLSLKKGVYGLLGANGAGKTTLMRMMCGVLQPDSGEILYDGMKVEEESYRDILGYLPQEFGYYPDFSAMDFLMYLASLKGIPKKQAREKSLKLLELTDLSPVAKKKIKTFSGGMKQRLGIAQSLLNNPKVLVLDEPTAGLDPWGREEILNQIASMHQELNMTILLVSHSMEDVAEYVKRIIVMNQGSILLDGAPKEVFLHQQKLEAAGLLVPQVTYLMQELKGRGIPVSVEVTTLKEAKEAVLQAFSNRRLG